MRITKLIGALFVVVAINAIGISTASAAVTLWKLLPGSVGETFTGSSEKATLQMTEVAGLGKPSITCKKSKVLLTESKLDEEGSTNKKDATLALAVIHFEECTSFGVPAESEGDASGIILVHVQIHTCMIKKAHFGLLLLVLPVHINILGGLNKLVLVRGLFVALLEGKEGAKALTFALNAVQKEGIQEIKLCEGGTEQSLEASFDGVTFVKAGEEAKNAKLEFDMTTDKEGEELMEK